MQLGRCEGFDLSIYPIISLNSEENLVDSGGYWAAVTFLYRPFISFALKGGVSVAISYSTQPNDQMSDLKL